MPIALVSAILADKIPASEDLRTAGLALLASVGTWVLAHFLSKKEERVLLDPATGERVVLGRNDSLFFIPVRFWPYLILAIGLVSILLRALKG
ncbi:hypothetical protein [Microvirga alba]|uniref:Uncharacterized protein n=1 Tax=Microvirga alba TaxID=2791025 RepID=A0A931FQ92_9HYPH|nr:hypothetical protein [Microvirga alba]MBF9234352.1 hypothetical protein [Microvirga alba]